MAGAIALAIPASTRPISGALPTNYQKGKFVRDGVFDPNAVSGQIGAMALLRRLIDIEGVNVPLEEDVPLPRRPSAAK